MRQLAIINKFFAPKRCRLSILDHDHPLDIIIQTPDLRESKYSCWGDWGPMYSIELNNQYFEISYFDRETQTKESHKLTPARVQLLSPMEVSEREIYPFFLNLFDRKKRMVFHIYLDRNGHPARVDALQVDNGVKHFASASHEDVERQLA